MSMLAKMVKSIDRSPTLSHPFKLAIGGVLVNADGGKAFDVKNPATEEVIAQCPEASRAQLNDAVAAAQQAFPSWSATSVEHRKKLLMRVAKKLQAPETIALLAKTLTLEQGKPLTHAVFEVVDAAQLIAQTCKLEYPRTEVVKEDDRRRLEVRYKPLGVVGCICPWNYPISQPNWKVPPALLTGNTVVVKPSPYTPLSTLILGEIYNEVFPPGVVNVVSGGDELGRWITSHAGVAKISFTGSTRTGMAIQKTIASDMKRCVLELGGNDAAIVLPGTDVAKVAGPVFRGAFANSGQVCAAIKRVYVHESQYDDFVAEITKQAQEAAKVLGDGMRDGVQYGPLCNEMQLDIVSSLVDDARKRGAVINCGGKRRGSRGFFYEPTIVSGDALNETVRLVSEEQFGPALPVVKYKSVDEAVRRANDSNYGLGGSVWGGDSSRCAEVAARLDCGTAWVNQHLNIAHTTPFGGSKHSGLGREHGKWGLSAFVEPQTVNVRKDKDAAYSSKSKL